MTTSCDSSTELRLLTAQELADVLGIHRETVYLMTADGRIRGYKVGVSWRYELEEVLEDLAV